jgi:V/A-type H+-transporting ATPase subunit A
MKERIIGQVKRVNGPVIEAMGVTDAMMLELVRVAEVRLIGEIIKLEGKSAVIQVYEDTTGICPGDNIYGSGMPLSVELGPGLIGTIYDGIQRPLEEIYKISGHYIEKGIQVSSINKEKKWHFVPEVLNPGSAADAGTIIGSVQETERISHKILLPPGTGGILKSIAPEGDYTVTDVIAVIETADSTKDIAMMQNWPIRVPRPVKERLPLNIPLITGQRVIDTLFPIAKGGTVAIPGGFGTGKTMTQQAAASAETR